MIPTKEGQYWHRDDPDDDWEIIELMEIGDALVVMPGDEHRAGIEAEFLPDFWEGPLKEPPK